MFASFLQQRVQHVACEVIDLSSRVRPSVPQRSPDQGEEPENMVRDVRRFLVPSALRAGRSVGGGHVLGAQGPRGHVAALIW